MNKRQAINEVRALAEDTIDQLMRLDKGWDKGDLRDDAPESWQSQPGVYRPSYRIDSNSHDAFYLSREFA